jgi:hypothetical protein
MMFEDFIKYVPIFMSLTSKLKSYFKMDKKIGIILHFYRVHIQLKYACRIPKKK